MNLKQYRLITNKHNGFPNTFDLWRDEEAVFPTRIDAENAIKDLEPYLIMKTLIEE